MPPIEPIEAEQIEVIYENGVLRPVRPLALAEGTRLEVIVTIVASATAVGGVSETVTEKVTETGTPSTEQGKSEEAEVDEGTYAVLLNELDSIAALPLQSAPQPQTARDHDAILYPKRGTMP